MMTQEQMNVLVPHKLHKIEQGYGVKILHAVETGSRAWGFASPDSDFDVRFIYIRPRNDYLRLNPHRDVIEMPVDDTWDVSGWDLHKALRLLWKSNPTVFEWMASRMPYIESDFAERIAPLLSEYFNPKSMLYHYYHMAENNIRVYLQGESVRIKKYFYALRPILACYWILDCKLPPSILFSELVEACLPEALKPEIDALIDIKVNHPEKEEISPIRVIHDYLDVSMEKLGGCLRELPNYKPLTGDPLNAFFLSELERAEEESILSRE